MLSLASVVGMAMIAQYIAMGGVSDDTSSRNPFTGADKISERKLVVRRPHGRKRRRYPYYESEQDFPHYSGHGSKYLYNHIVELPAKDEPAIDDYGEIDFYEDKNYEYIDQEDIETVK